MSRELLQRDDVTLYETAIRLDDLLVLVDVMRKRGHHVDWFEVKSKSYALDKDGDLRTKNGLARKFRRAISRSGTTSSATHIRNPSRSLVSCWSTSRRRRRSMA